MFLADRILIIGRLAQRPRALALQARSRRFESSTAHHCLPNQLAQNWRAFQSAKHPSPSPIITRQDLIESTATL